MRSARIALATSAAEETKKVAGAIAELLGPGDVVSLAGDLGAGKTTFVQGAAEALGVTEPVTSPTFVLVREYRSGQVPIYHVDVYRLDRLHEVLDLGFEDFLDPHGVVFVEWGSAVEAVLPEERLDIELTLEGGEETRALVVAGRGPSWTSRWERVEAVVGPWSVA
ncbi:MAG: tRNA (adenosine(37)-N6)-threonylcarbamoyltransferase complex ATPase subunit type 1 TsaE [Actinomycetota bacterium]